MENQEEGHIKLYLKTDSFNWNFLSIAHHHAVVQSSPDWWAFKMK